MEDNLYDIESMRHFAKVGLQPIFGESTIYRFRHYLEARNFTKKLFQFTEQYLSERGLILSEGATVDANIISAPSSTKNEKRARDPEMKQTKKGNHWHFDMKTHIGTNRNSLIHSAVVADASVHDCVVMGDLFHSEESETYGYKAYVNDEKRAQAEADGVNWRVNRKARRGRKLSYADKLLTERVIEDERRLNMPSVYLTICGGIARPGTRVYIRMHVRHSPY